MKSKKDLKYYYGLTVDLGKRVREHNNGSVKSTKPRAPFELIYFETTETLPDARKREKYFKSGFGRKYVQGKIKDMAPSSNG